MIYVLDNFICTTRHWTIYSYYIYRVRFVNYIIAIIKSWIYTIWTYTVSQKR